ncbi:amidophosphoribosyltransferase [Deinococcus roseus]|uniref:Amidophosphoribosyltransferase n=1 Tax=Deinococcus roseus TaxID=392414 RepID=A0ABQ2CXD4_9DEIO|nr:amidophosphoribosyltransferase [Deinococcus roseus]
MFPQLCPGCQQALTTPAALCERCTPTQAQLTSESVLLDTTAEHLIYLGAAEGKWRRMVHALKYQNNTGIARSLGPTLARSVPQAWKLDVLCPVPLHPRRERERGYNQSRLLAEAVGQHLHLPTRDLLKRVIYTHQQAKLHHTERQHNLKGVFALNASAQNLNILLIDDVLSTGATLRASAEVLHRGGANNVYFLVIAR